MRQCSKDSKTVTTQFNLQTQSLRKYNKGHNANKKAYMNDGNIKTYGHTCSDQTYQISLFVLVVRTGGITESDVDMHCPNSYILLWLKKSLGSGCFRTVLWSTGPLDCFTAPLYTRSVKQSTGPRHTSTRCRVV